MPCVCQAAFWGRLGRRLHVLLFGGLAFVLTFCARFRHKYTSTKCERREVERCTGRRKHNQARSLSTRIKLSLLVHTSKAKRDVVEGARSHPLLLWLAWVPPAGFASSTRACVCRCFCARHNVSPCIAAAVCACPRSAIHAGGGARRCTSERRGLYRELRCRLPGFSLRMFSFGRRLVSIIVRRGQFR